MTLLRAQIACMNTHSLQIKMILEESECCLRVSVCVLGGGGEVKDSSDVNIRVRWTM